MREWTFYTKINRIKQDKIFGWSMVELIAARIASSSSEAFDWFAQLRSAGNTHTQTINSLLAQKVFKTRGPGGSRCSKIPKEPVLSLSVDAQTHSRITHPPKRGARVALVYTVALLSEPPQCSTRVQFVSLSLSLVFIAVMDFFISYNKTKRDAIIKAVINYTKTTFIEIRCTL